MFQGREGYNAMKLSNVRLGIREQRCTCFVKELRFNEPDVQI